MIGKCGICLRTLKIYDVDKILSKKEMRETKVKCWMKICANCYHKIKTYVTEKQPVVSSTSSFTYNLTIIFKAFKKLFKRR